MRHSRHDSAVLCFASAVVSVFLSSCSGGGGGGGGKLILITADGASAPLWALVNGVPTVPPSCPIGVFLNGRITFTFDGPVDPASSPSGVFAIGSLNILSEVTGIPAEGTFTVEDDPALSNGNQRRVVFSPALPADPGVRCSGGVDAFQNYEVSVPFGTTSPNVIVVDGERIETGATTCFRTCGCPDGGGCAAPFLDAVAGPPVIMSTSPATSNPAPTAIDRCTIAGQVIQILFSEPLDPAGVTLANIQVVNLGNGVQIPGSLVFHQATTVDGTSQVDYVLMSPPPPGGTTFQVVVGPGVTDFGGNSVVPAQLFFQTSPVASVPQPPLVETFDSSNPGGVSGAAAWTGNGMLAATFPIEIVGNGADGSFNPPVGTTTILDTNQLVSGQSRAGIWNFTSVNIPATATVRVIGPYQGHFRCTSTFTLEGAINANAASGPFVSVNFYDRGPEIGIQNNGAGLNCEANGGVGNAGGGNGGTGSGVTPPPGSPPTFQCTVRVSSGEAGYGPTIDGAQNPGSSPNPFYAGGRGGDSGCFPAAGAGCTAGDLGGLGGAGGTAARVGEAGLPRVATAACTPNPVVVQPIAQPSPVPPVVLPPISVQSAGSGGGGGGDHWEPTGVPPGNDDQGGGAGGGGGGVRISCASAFQMGGGPITAQITARGAQGNTAQAQGGGGGSGSGGEVWIQTFATVAITAASTIDVTGPGRLSPTVGAVGCSNQAAGGGGAGLVQIEAGQGPTPTPTFNLQPTPTPTTGAVFSAPPFGFGGTVVGIGRSGLRFAAPAPDYTGAIEVLNLGNAAGATVVIRYEGAFEAVNSTPVNRIPDLATVKSMATGGGPITAANLDELDGYPFIEFIAELSYPAPPATASTATLPSVDSITINFDAEPPCP